MISSTRCKICRRLNQKLFLKGERCLTAKCSMIKKAYAPGQRGKRRSRGISEYGRELQEKQKLRNWYNLSEKQFKNYVKKILEKKGQVEDASSFLIERLETRFDNIIYRMGFGSSRVQARQLISHSHFLINNKPVNIPSYQLKKGDKISIRPRFLKTVFFQDIAKTIKKHKAPSWIKVSFDKEKIEGEIINMPSLEEASPPAEIPAIFEYYSR